MHSPSRILLLLLLAFCLPALAIQETQLPDWPAVRKPREDWVQAAATVKNPAWSDWLAAKETQVQAWMAKSPEDATQSVGWLQNYVDLATGKFMQWTPDTPPPSDVNSKAYAAWRANVRIYNVEQILESARLFRLTGNPAYLEWARGQLNAYAQNYGSLPLQTWNGQARLFSQALDEAVYAFTLLDAVRLLRPHVPSSDIERWRDGLFVPMSGLLRASVKGYDNISLWIVAALSVMADEFQLAELNSFALSSSQGLQNILAQGVSSDQYWYEMSLQYQDYVVKALASWLYGYGIRPDNQGGKEQMRTQIGTTTRNLMLSPLYIRFTDSDAPALNDTQGARKIPNTEFWASLWRVLPTPVGLTAARTSKSWDTLLDPPPGSVASEALPKVVSKVVNGLDSVLLTSRGWQALIRYGARSTHAHQETLSYDLKYDGVWVFRDQGTVGYGAPLHLNYFRRAHAHAAPLIDRDGQLPWPAEGRVASFTSPGTAKVEQARYSRGHAVSRELRIDASGFNDTVEFKLTGTTPKPVGLVFNTRCQPSYPAEPLAEDSLSKIGPFQYWTQRAQYAIGSKVEIGLDCAGQKFTLSFEGADLKTLFMAAVPEAGKEQSRGFYLETQPVLNSTIKLRIQAAGI